MLFYYAILFLYFNNKIINIIPIGNIREKPSPTEMLLPNCCDIAPTTSGPTVHPVSPAKASNPNSDADEPNLAAARLIVPGQNIATAKPQSAIPTNDSVGEGEKAVNIKPTVSKEQDKII